MKIIYSLRHCIVLTSFFIISLSNTYAADLTQVQQLGEEKLKQAKASQERIDKIVDSAQGRLIQYRSLLKQVEGLKAYNEQLSKQIESQKDLITRFDNSITQVSLIERQMVPLINKMARSLKNFVEIDLPFSTTERQERMVYIQESLSSADTDLAEKFRLIIEAYQIENEYGRKIDHFEEIILIDDTPYEVDVLRVGRITMVAQTKDTQTSAYWNNASEQWELLDNTEYRSSIREGIKMAKKQASINIVSLPISAPEVSE